MVSPSGWGRITCDSAGEAYIGETGVAVETVTYLLSNGSTTADIIGEFPDLTAADVADSVRYAQDRSTCSRGFPYRPNGAFPPGETLDEWMKYLGVSLGELAGRSGVPADVLARILDASVPVTAELAVMLENGTGIPATMWTNLQKNYDRFERPSSSEVAERGRRRAMR